MQNCLHFQQKSSTVYRVSTFQGVGFTLYRGDFISGVEIKDFHCTQRGVLKSN